MREYAALLAWSFLAATVLPLGSEVPLAMIVRDREDILLPVIVATIGNSLGAFTTYWLGRKAADLADEREVVTARARRAADLLRRYGQPAVFFSWIPVIGDALVAAAGASAMPLRPFAAWVIAQGASLRRCRPHRAQDRLSGDPTWALDDIGIRCCDRSMSFFRAHRRATLFLFALTFLTIATKGICMMPAADNGKAGAHACCKKGWQTALPSCCMEVGTDGTAAKVTARVGAPAPAVATPPPVGVTAQSALAVGHIVAYADSVHSPPPRTILRV